MMSRLKKMADKFEASTNAVKEVQDQELLDFTARKPVSYTHLDVYKRQQ